MPRVGLDQQTVLRAASEIADEQGFDGVTLAILAQNLGIRTPSLYNHVDGLPGLRKQLVIHGMNMLNDTLTRAAVGKSKDDAITAIAEAYLAFARQHPGLYEATQRSLDWQDTEIQQAAQQIVELVARVLLAYRLKGEAAIHTVRGLRSLLHGFASIEQQGGFGMPLNLDESFHWLIETFLAGIYSQTSRMD